jgi:hypothetical protein
MITVLMKSDVSYKSGEIDAKAAVDSATMIHIDHKQEILTKRQVKSTKHLKEPICAKLL